VNNFIAIEPKALPSYVAAVESAGGQVVPLSPEVTGLVWTSYHKPEVLAKVLVENPQLTWVQLPWAGVDAFADTLKHPVRFTSAKGAYREPVAEHALMLAMALGRKLPERVRAKSWGNKFAVSLYDASVLIVGGGGITEELIRLLEPFRSRVTVVRNQSVPLKGADITLTLEDIDEHVATADFVILACALTPQTRGLFDARRFAVMKSTSYLVNIARGPVINTSDLVAALDAGVIAGAAIDVTDPEPLPDGHPAWDCDNLLITPHTADTPEQVERLFAARIEANVAAHLGRGHWVGVVDAKLGY
jgi:phosphoglycerate dehydrogenase-like enzyme